MPRCEACPVPEGQACPDEGAHCGAIARGEPGRADQLRAIAAARADRAASLAIARLVHHCPARGPACSPCGSFATCRAGKGHPETGAISYQECTICKTEGDSP